MDTAKWPQEFVVKPMNEIVTNTNTTTTTTRCLKQPNPPPPVVDTTTTTTTRKARPEKDEALNCPRCNSLNTKFCYYNNYSLTQPRYFCKDCRRYWTEGGSLRNIPIGGGVRKNKRSSSSKKPVYTPTLPSVNPPQQPNPNKMGENAAKAQELGFSTNQGFGIGHHHQTIPEFMQVVPNNPLVSTSSSALELLGISSTNNSSNNPRPPPTSPFMPFPIVQDSSLNYTTSSTGGGRDMGFGMSYPQFQEFMRPTGLGFSLDGGTSMSMYGGDHQENGRPLLPFESLKLPTVSSKSTKNEKEKEEQEQEKEDGSQSVGYWSGMLSGGASSSAGTASWH